MQQLESAMESYLYENNEIINDLSKNWGSPISQKAKSTTRIAFQNVNGLGLESDPASEIFDVMNEYNIDIFGCAETNINWSQLLRDKVTTALRLQFGGGQVIPSSITATKEGYLQGGVALFVTGPAHGRIVARGADKLGRFSWARLTSPGGNGIVVITAYRVCQKRGTTAGAKTAYMQQVKAHLKDGDKTPDPREKILEALATLIADNHRMGYDPILMLDANEDWEKSGDNAFHRFIIHHGLLDIHQELLTQVPRTTYTRGRRRLDFSLTTKKVMESISACGILANHEGVISDHTLQFVDFHNKKLFGKNSPTIVPSQQREFLFDNSVKREQFVEDIKRMHTHQSIEKRVTDLNDKFLAEGASTILIEEYNKIDYEITCTIKAAAKNVSRKNFGYQRSQMLTDAGSVYMMWKAAYSCKCRKVPLTNRTMDLAHLTGTSLNYVMKRSIHDTQQEIRLARQHLKEVQRADASNRSQWLEEKAREKAILDSTDTEKVLKKMIRNAHFKSLQRKLTNIAKGSQSSLDHVEVPTHDWYHSSKKKEIYHFDNGIFETHGLIQGQINQYHRHHTIKVIPLDSLEVLVSHHPSFIQVDDYLTTPLQWDTVRDRTTLESTIIRRNKRHLQQVDRENGIPMSTEFKSIIDDYGTSPAADNVLRGELTLELESMPLPVRNVLRKLARTELERGVPLITGDITPDEFKKAFKAVTEKTSSSPSGMHYTLWKSIANDKDLATYFSIMLSLPFRYGFVNNRWTKCVEVMLEKSPGNKKIHQLRIIGLLEADFNTALKLFFAKKMMWNAESLPLSDEQWGGRPNRSANDAALRKRVTFDFGLVMYHSEGLFMMDAAACFDRMVPSISSIVAQKFGISKNILRSRNATISNMQRSIRTSHGASQQSYNQVEYEPILNGEVQGKGDVPSIWSLESQILIQAHHDMCHGIELISANKHKRSKRNNDVFVDDTDNWAECTSMRPDSATITVTTLTAAAQAWADILAVTGGAIAFDKCKWTGLTWDFTTSPPSLLDEPPGEISLLDHMGAATIITKTSASTPNKGLGHRMAPDGNQNDEFKFRLEQCHELARRIAPARLTFEESYLMLITRILPKVTYSMPITMFDKKQCKRLNTPIDQVLLPKLGVNRHMPKAIVYSPLKHGGMNFPKIESIQDQKGIMFLIKQLRWGKALANDILVVLSSIQLMSGLTTPILEDPSPKIEYIKTGWIGHIRQRLATLKGEIWIEDQWTPLLQREQDASIMHTFLTIPGITRKKLERANYWRIYLRIITVSDIADEIGKIVPSGRLYGQWQAHSTLNWPDIPKPDRKCMNDFNWCFRKSFLHNSNVRNNRKQQQLTIPLGPWLGNNCHILYEYSMTESAAFQRQQDGIQRYARIFNTNIFDIDIKVDTIPSNAQPIRARSDSSHLWTQCIYNRITNLPTPEQQPERLLIKPTHNNIIVSDGTSDPRTGEGAAYTIAQFGTTQLEIGDLMPQSDQMTSYRSELVGIHRGLTLAKEHNIQNARQYTDSKSSVDKLSSQMTPTMTIGAEADLLLSINHLRTQMEHPPTLLHVRAHQDESTKFEDLPIEAQLNSLCDTNANEVRRGTIPSFPSNPPYIGSKAMLRLNNRWITSNYESKISEALTQPLHEKYIKEKWDWTSEQYASIRWKHIGLVRKRLTKAENIRVMKAMYKWTPVGQKNFDQQHSPCCPCCGYEDETFDHLYQCPDPRMVRSREDAFVTMEKYLQTKKVPVNLRLLTLRIVRAHCSNTTLVLHNTNPDTVAISESQASLGLPFFVRGFLTQAWQDAADSASTEDTAEQIAAIIYSLWQLLFQPIWETRNNILHKTDSHVTTIQHESCNRDLSLFSQNAVAWLGPHNSFLGEYNIQYAKSWQLSTKHEMLKILTIAKTAYSNELRNPHPTQRRITAYFRKT